MKFSDITGQDVTTLTEAPMGFMKTLGTAAKAINPFSLSGRNQAQGQFKTGVSANQIYAQYYKWLGQTGSPADTDTVLAFLQQNGYGEQAVKAAQSKFPAAPQQTTPANTSTTATPTATPPANQKLTPQQQTALKAKMQGQRQGGANMSAKTGTGFKNYVAGSGQRIQGANPDGSPKVVTINRESREWLNEAGIPLTKDQLSAIFTAVAQSGAVPQQATSTDSDGNSAQTVTAQGGGDDTADNRQQTTDQQPKNSGRSSQMPNRLTPDDILQYYARLTSPYERDQVKKGIPEVDKQLSQGAQQARQQPAK
jgi:hypothetical protein